ncbi:MAG TPA: hypothetical protein VFM45_13860 [Anaeromyxobacteraceae bacterium]|nr:hypothetical protein [Anaeromyxobacteraceae bacterium]
MGTLLAIVVGVVVAVLVLRKLEGAAASVALVLGALAFLAVMLLERGRPRVAAGVAAPVFLVLLLGGVATWVSRRQPRAARVVAGAVVGALVGVPAFVAVLQLIEHLGWRDAEQYPMVRVSVAIVVVSVAAVAGGWIGWRRSAPSA